MRKIIMTEETGTIHLSKVVGSNLEHAPIFAKQDGKLAGMITKETDGWILRVGGFSGATGHHETLKRLIESCVSCGYEFFV